MVSIKTASAIGCDYLFVNTGIVVRRIAQVVTAVARCSVTLIARDLNKHGGY